MRTLVLDFGRKLGARATVFGQEEQRIVAETALSSSLKSHLPFKPTDRFGYDLTVWFGDAHGTNETRSAIAFRHPLKFSQQLQVIRSVTFVPRAIFPRITGRMNAWRTVERIHHQA